MNSNLLQPETSASRRLGSRSQTRISQWSKWSIVTNSDSENEDTQNSDDETLVNNEKTTTGSILFKNKGVQGHFEAQFARFSVPKINKASPSQEQIGQTNVSDNEKSEKDTNNEINEERNQLQRKVEVLAGIWFKKRPSLIVSIAGGRSNLKMDNSKLIKMKSNLQKVLNIKRSCIITSGTNVGMAKICGEAFKDYILSSKSPSKAVKSAKVVGVTTWGCVYEVKKHLDYTKEIEPRGNKKYNYPANAMDRSLESNHSHFLFADDGTENEIDRETELRKMFENCVRQLHDPDKEAEKCVPTVCLLINGGVGALETVKNALENNIPVVAVQGSGRAADWLAYAIERPEAFGKKAVETSISDYQNEIGFRSDDAETIKEVQDIGNKLHDLLFDCLEANKKEKVKSEDGSQDGEEMRANLITVLKSEKFDDLDYAILKSIVEPGSEMSPANQLKVAFKWNRSDEVRSLIKDPKMKNAVKTCLFESLVKNQLEFAKSIVYIEKLENFSRHDLCLLYKHTFKDYYSPPDPGHYLQKLENLTKKGLADAETEVYLQEITKAMKSIGVEYDFSTTNTQESNPLTSKSNKRDKTSDVLDCAARDLFVFSVLFLRIDASLFFWQFVQFAIPGALFAVLLLKSVSNIVSIEDQAQVKKIRDIFQQKAIALMNKCFENNEKKCLDLLKTKQPNWGSLNCFDLATRSGAKLFLAETPVQKYIQRKWMGSLTAENSTLKIFLSTVILVKVWNLKFVQEAGSTLKQRMDNKSNKKKNKVSPQSKDVSVPQIIEPTTQKPDSNVANVSAIPTASGVELAANEKSESKYANQSLALPSISGNTEWQLKISVPEIAQKESSTVSSVHDSTIKTKQLEKKDFQKQTSTSFYGYVSLSSANTNGQSSEQIQIPQNSRDESTKPISQAQEQEPTYCQQTPQNKTEDRNLDEKPMLIKSIFKQVWNVMRRYWLFINCPVVKFCYYYLFFLFFLVIFSTVNLKGLKEDTTTMEWVVIVWVFCLAFDEVQQCVCMQTLGPRSRIRAFLDAQWNVFDVSAFGVALCGFILRLPYFWDLREVAHGFYVAALLFYFIRFTSFFGISSYLGPKLSMIRKMMVELLIFFVLIYVYLVAYGISVHSLVYPNVFDPFFTVIWGIFLHPFFEMLGDPNFEGVGALHLENCVNGSEAIWPYRNCPNTKQGITYYAIALKAVFMLFTNVLLLNLLIALFNNCYESVNEKSQLYWRYQRFIVTTEFSNRFPLPPPLNVLSVFFCAWKQLRKCFGKEYRQQSYPKQDINLIELQEWESKWMRDLHFEELQKMKESSFEDDFNVFISKSSEQFTNIRDRLQRIEETSVSIEDLREIIEEKTNLQDIQEHLKTIEERIQTQTEDNLKEIIEEKTNLQDIQKHLKTIEERIQTKTEDSLKDMETRISAKLEAQFDRISNLVNNQLTTQNESQ